MLLRLVSGFIHLQLWFIPKDDGFERILWYEFGKNTFANVIYILSKESSPPISFCRDFVDSICINFPPLADVLLMLHYGHFACTFSFYF